MRRARSSPVAVLLGAGVGLGVLLLTVALLEQKGQLGGFFERGDARMYWLTGRDLFGTGNGFAALGRASEVPYRYGRMGLPLAAWLLAAGQPQLVGSTLIAVNVVAIAAVAGLAALLIEEYGGHPATAVSGAARAGTAAAHDERRGRAADGRADPRSRTYSITRVIGAAPGGSWRTPSS